MSRPAFRPPRFLPLVLLATTVPLVLLSVLLTALYQRDKRTAASDRLLESAEAVSGGIDEFLETQRRATLSLAGDLSRRDGPEGGSLEPWLAHQHTLHPGFLSMIVTDHEGRVIAASPPTGADGRRIVEAGWKVDDRAYFREPLRKGQPYISEPFQGRGFGNDPIVAVSAPYRDRRGEFAGVVEGSLNLVGFERFSAIHHRMRGFEVIVLDSEGIVLWASPGAGMAPLMDARDLASQTRPSAVVRGEIGDEPYLLASVRSRIKPWTVIVRRSWSDIRKITVWGSLLTASSAALALALSIFLVYRMSQPLRESERRFREMAARSFGFLCMHDLEGKLLMVNPAAAERLGYTPEELEGRSLADILAPSVRDQFSEYLGRLMNGEMFEGSMRVITRNGQERIWAYRNHRVVEEGRAPYVLGHALDVTERWQAENTLRRRAAELARDLEERKKIERMKDDFISVVSHELRTPLTSIRGSLGLIQGGVAGEIPDQARSLFDIAATNCERLARLIDDILDTEKLESGRMVFHFEPVELARLAEQAVLSLQAHAQAHEVELRLVETAPETWVWADADRILQVLTNLLSNAVKFSPPGGQVEVAVARNGEGVKALVTDHGEGIPPGFRFRIFEKFAQADSSRTRKNQGTGLGLNICRAIIERHGGRIWFDSEPGVATTFGFELKTSQKDLKDLQDPKDLEDDTVVL
ncbi:MAG TPA: ATP-binding protein [Thermoanaerobaculia bacterium]|nr:ATP-binding protein [Thermoanaerobaculia bacterium]